MDKLRQAVDAGIITEAQRDAIEAIPDDPRTFRFSLVHLLWLAGAGLIVFALLLLAAELSQGEAERLMWICLVYSGGLAALDQGLRGRAGVRLLSSLVLLSMGATAAIAVGAFIESQWGLVAPGTHWSRFGAWYEPFLRGLYLPGAVIIGVSALLVVRRGFLPAWLALLAVLATYSCDMFFGPRLDDVVEASILWLGLSVLALAAGWWFDLAPGPNHGFWINKAGLLAFSIYTFVALVEGAFGSRDYWHLLPAGIAVALYSLYLRRPAGISAGALALAVYLAHWFDAWDNVYVAAAILGVIGLGSIYLGVKAHLVENRLDRLLPSQLRRLRPDARSDPVTFGF